jgi:GNAT superfamily N-acetyltransferase
MGSGDAGTIFEIRRAVPDDWAMLRRVRLGALAWPNFIAWAGAEPVGLAGAMAEPAEPAEPGRSGRRSGGAGASGSWHLVSMWVSPQAQGQGIADRLVAAVAACARADGAERLTLWVADASTRARAFYLRIGFRSTGRRQLVRPEEPDHWEEEQVLDLSRPTVP